MQMVPERPDSVHASLSTWVNSVTFQSLPALMTRTLVTTAGSINSIQICSLSVYFYSTCMSSDSNNSSFVCECDGHWQGYYCTGMVLSYCTNHHSLAQLTDCSLQCGESGRSDSQCTSCICDVPNTDSMCSKFEH